MKHRNIPRSTMSRIGWSALALAATTWQAHAATDPVIGQVTASLSNLRYELIDLDLNDGITPGFTLSSDFDYNVFQTRFERNFELDSDTTLPGTLFSSNTQTLTGSDGIATAAKLNAGMSTSLLMHASDVKDSDYEHVINMDPPPSEVYGGMSTKFNFDNRVGIDPYAWVKNRWTLTPNTELILKGDVLLDAKADASGLTNSPLLAEGADLDWVLRMGVFGSFELNLIPDEPTVYFQATDDLDYMRQILVQQELGPDGTRSLNGVPTEQSFSKAFTMSYRNFGPEQVEGLVDARVRASAGLSAYAKPIPEPGTWALMALGLGVMGWRVRALRTGRQA